MEPDYRGVFMKIQIGIHLVLTSYQHIKRYKITALFNTLQGNYLSKGNVRTNHK